MDLLMLMQTVHISLDVSDHFMYFIGLQWDLWSTAIRMLPKQEIIKNVLSETEVEKVEINNITNIYWVVSH